MEADELRKIIDRDPFQPFTIHMNDGSKLRVAQPDDVFLHRTWLDEAIVVLGKGNWSFVYLPKDLPHRFRVRGTTPAKFLAFGTPGGVEHLYREVGVPATELVLPSPPTPEEFGRWPAAAPKYGLELLGPPLPE